MISLGLKYRFHIVIAIIILLISGVYQYGELPVDALPDVSPVMVPIFAEAHGMAPEEVERLITFPIESAMNGLPDVTNIKSTSAFGMAVIYVYFKDSVDMYFARQIVAERLNDAISQLPELHELPKLGPISTGLGQIFIYYLTMDDNVDTGGKDKYTYLRELNDWVVKYQLQAVPGVTDILSMGGHVLQYQIKLDPDAMSRYKINIEEVVESVRENNGNVGGQFMVLGSEEHTVRGIGFLKNLDDIRSIPVKVANGVPIKIGEIADVEFGRELRRGVVTRMGEEEVVSGIVMQLYGENTSKVIERLYKKINNVKKNLPQGVKLVTFYEQANLVKEATWTVKKSLLIGAAMVLGILLFFLGNFRSAIIVALALPICALISVIMMRLTGISANLMSLGGIAIGIGMLCDGAIVMVENIYRHLRENKDDDRLTIITKAAMEVSSPITFSILIIVIVFLPIFTLEGVEGKMFSPMAFTISFALLGSLFVALFVSPTLCFYSLKIKDNKELWILGVLKRFYHFFLILALKFKYVLFLAAFAAFVFSIMMIPHLGTEFIPVLEEGSIFIGVTMAPSISLETATKKIMKLEKIVNKFPQVKETIARIGRPEAGSHPHPVNYAEIHIQLKNRDEWGNVKNKQEIVESMNKELLKISGIQLNFTQPIQNSFDELLSGIKAQLAVKIFGDDLNVLKDTAEKILHTIDNIPGLVDVSVEQSFGQPQIHVIADRDACSRYGINVSSILELVELAIGGEVIDQIYLNTRRFGIHVRYKEEFRKNPQVIGDLLIQSADGEMIPLRQVAKIEHMLGASQINREKNQRRWTIMGNIRGRDLGSVVADIKARIDEKIKLPSGYFVEYGGQFENQIRAMNKLSMILPVVLCLVFLMLYLTFNCIRHSLIILVNVPLALIGGIGGLYITGEYLSVPAAVGFIALFGIAVQNGVVLVSSINQLVEKGFPVKNAILESCMLRLRPVLMTALTTILGLLPLLLSTGLGSEVQRPLAVVVIYGLISSTILTLFIIPPFYELFGERKNLKSKTPNLEFM